MYFSCRFKDALAHFTDSMQMVNKRITPGKLTWPLTKEIVKETQLDHFKVQGSIPIQYFLLSPNAYEMSHYVTMQ